MVFYKYNNFLKSSIYPNKRLLSFSLQNNSFIFNTFIKPFIVVVMLSECFIGGDIQQLFELCQVVKVVISNNGRWGRHRQESGYSSHRTSMSNS